MTSLIRAALRIFVLAAVLRIVYPVLLDYLGWRLPNSDSTVCDSAQGFALDVYDRRNLTRQQCSCIFPALESEIKNCLTRGPFELERLPSSINGHVQARIGNGKVGDRYSIL